MRALGTVLLFLGLVAAVVGGIHGCNALFSWNGRHAVETKALGDAPLAEPLVPQAGRRYTLSIVVVFDRETAEIKDGVPFVEAKMPVVVSAKDSYGTSLAEFKGWLDPTEPPNVLLGTDPHDRELAVERLVGPFTAATATPIALAVDLGPDRVGKVRIVERRFTVYDDALPPAIERTGIVVGAGVVMLVAGVFVLVSAWFRRRGRKRV